MGDLKWEMKPTGDDDRLVGRRTLELQERGAHLSTSHHCLLEIGNPRCERANREILCDAWCV